MIIQPNELLNGLTKPHVAKNFGEFRDTLEYLQKSRPWTSNIIYRGHGKEEYKLSSTLERLVKDINDTEEKQTGNSNKFRKRKDAEDWLLQEFRRGIHHHHQVTLDDDDRLGWLSLMQHHGTPTRLLDWTLSPYVALYFAAQPGNKECAVYACSPAILDGLCGDIQTVADVDEATRMTLTPLMEKLVTSNSDIEARHEAINDLLRCGAARDLPIAAVIRPFRLNLRVVAQQGVFMVPLSDELPFEKCLLQSALKSRHEGPLLHKITIKEYNRNEILRELQRMNISQQTLFPGLDGYAKSLADHYELSAESFFL